MSSKSIFHRIRLESKEEFLAIASIENIDINEVKVTPPVIITPKLTQPPPPPVPPVVNVGIKMKAIRNPTLPEQYVVGAPGIHNFLFRVYSKTKIVCVGKFGYDVTKATLFPREFEVDIQPLSNSDIAYCSHSNIEYTYKDFVDLLAPVTEDIKPTHIYI